DCFTGKEEHVRRLSRDAYHLARRSVSASEQEAYALKVPDGVLKEFADFAEKLFLFQMERNYNSLKFYHEVKGLPASGERLEETKNEDDPL
ncbi:MAG: hypothetical protein J6Z79_03315, partial [Clostridia bacterium]|nr:hypothetical protein [Clostridia bacterium]